MLRRFHPVAACVLALAFTPRLGAQQPGVFDSIRTPHGTCRVWVGIPGGTSHEDRSYARCALDRAPVLLSEGTLPQPWTGSPGNGRFTVVVDVDGTVNRDLTRAWLLGMDSVAYRYTLEGIRRWRFRPGMRGGVAVRSGFVLHVESEVRNDTVPADLRWTYREVPSGEDTLRGRWVPRPAAPSPLTEAQFDSLHTAVFRRLVHMRVVAPWLEHRYCLVPGEGVDGESATRVLRALERLIPSRDYHGAFTGHGGGIAGPGCERTPGLLRVFVPRAHRTEDDRVVLSPSGDYLADWPPGFRGATYPSWSSRCVANVPADAPAQVHCDIRPQYTRAPDGTRAWERGPAPEWYRPGDSIRVTVIARMSEAFQTDTMRTVVHDLRRFGRSAVLDDGVACASGWSAFTAQDSAVLYVVKGDLEGRSSLSVTRVRHRPPPPRPRNAECTGSAEDSLLAMFILGDVGDPIRAPVTFCIGDPLCTRQYELDPARHTVAERAHLRFRLADLREHTRVGDQLRFRILVDPVPEGLTPLILVRHGDRPPASVLIARRVELGAWDFDVTYDSGIPPDSDVAIYLAAR